MHNRNTGDRNTGNWNTGDRNTGDWNTGNRNTGSWNTGNCNTGNCNTGDWNTGRRNTGSWNTGDWNTGYLNTGEGSVYVFGKKTNIRRADLVFPDFFYHNTTAVWVPLSSMRENERMEHSGYEVDGGYLKKMSSHAGWRAAWDSADEEDRKKCLDIPNWNNEMFKEISGIDVEAELAAGGAVELTVAEIEKIVGRKVKVIKG